MEVCDKTALQAGCFHTQLGIGSICTTTSTAKARATSTFTTTGRCTSIVLSIILFAHTGMHAHKAFISVPNTTRRFEKFSSLRIWYAFRSFKRTELHLAEGMSVLARSSTCVEPTVICRLLICGLQKAVLDTGRTAVLCAVAVASSRLDPP